MPAQVVVVFPDPAVLDGLASAIGANGHTVRTFADPMLALNALDQAQHVELLITGVHFSSGKPNGRSLALMARLRRPGIRLIFICSLEEEEHVADLGRCLRPPVDVPAVAALAETLLNQAAA